MSKPIAVIHHDRRYVSKDGRSPGKIKVTWKFDNPRRWVRRFYGDGMFTRGEFSKPRSDEKRKDMTNLSKLLSQATDIIEKNDNITIALFESQFLGISLDTLNGAFIKIIDDLRAEGRIGTRKTYTTALNSFKQYAKQNEIRFVEVTPEWLEGYVRWTTKKEMSINSAAINLRTLRAVFNYAIRIRVIPADLYPFKFFKIRSERKFKIPLTDKEIEAIKNYEAPTFAVEIKQIKADSMAALKAIHDDLLGGKIAKKVYDLKANSIRYWTPIKENGLIRKAKGIAEALDYFLFSYYCNGMNMVDVAKLRHSDIQDEFLIYDRSKTRHTKTQFKKIIIPIGPEILAIIKRRGNPTLNPKAYIFPVLEENLSEVTIKNRVLRWIADLNTSLGFIAEDLKIKKKLTTVIARHTFANRMSNFGADRRMIQEALGHQNSETTEHYLGTMDIEKIKEARKAL
jgi:integrase/recombinase XerD